MMRTNKAPIPLAESIIQENRQAELKPDETDLLGGPELSQPTSQLV
jgi:hypothetical protein